MFKLLFILIYIHILVFFLLQHMNEMPHVCLSFWIPGVQAAMMRQNRVEDGDGGRRGGRGDGVRSADIRGAGGGGGGGGGGDVWVG